MVAAAALLGAAGLLASWIPRHASRPVIALREA
jgi:hypothetical protein